MAIFIIKRPDGVTSAAVFASLIPETIITTETTPLPTAFGANDRVMIYQRKLDGESYTVALNFSFSKIKPPKKHAGLLSGTKVASASGGKYEGLLLPWDGLLVKN